MECETAALNELHQQLLGLTYRAGDEPSAVEAVPTGLARARGDLLEDPVTPPSRP